MIDANFPVSRVFKKENLERGPISVKGNIKIDELYSGQAKKSRSLEQKGGNNEETNTNTNNNRSNMGSRNNKSIRIKRPILTPQGDKNFTGYFNNTANQKLQSTVSHNYDNVYQSLGNINYEKKSRFSSTSRDGSNSKGRNNEQTNSGGN